MINHWGTHFPQLHNLFKRWHIVADEYPVENTHSIIRSQTSDLDTAEVLSKKVKATFQSKEKQKNFRSSFTPPTKFSFSISQLQFLKLKAATLLTSIFESIVHNPMNAKFHSKVNKKKKVTEVQMPQIFGEKKLSDCVLPLGYHGKHQPDQNCKCDMPLSNSTQEQAWIIFQGCGHSFHKLCITAHHCPLCNETLQEKVKELGQKCKDAILFPHKKKDLMVDDVDVEIEKADADEDIQLPATDETTIDVGPLHQKLSGLHPSTPKNHHQLPQQSPHKSPTNHFVKPHTTMSASLHKPSQPMPAAATASYRSTHKSKSATLFPPQSTHTSSPCCNDTVFRVLRPGIIEWLLPPRLSQSGLSNNLCGSNACTVISVLGALNLSTTSYFPVSMQEIHVAATYFTQIMLQGNLLYESLSMQPDNPNLDVVDVLTKLPALQMVIKEETGFVTADDMVGKLESIRQEDQSMVGVLIIAPDKSMVIYMDNNNLGLMDSHCHGQHGGLIVTSTSGNAKDFVGYLSYMAKQYWNASLAGANFTILEQYSTAH